MQPYQLSLLPIYYLDKNSEPVHFVHVTDVISIEYAKKFNLHELYETMERFGASCAVRTAESQLALWVPRPGTDSFSMIDEKIPLRRRGANVFLRSDGCFYSVGDRMNTGQACAHAA
jgi:hypothetical protein